MLTVGLIGCGGMGAMHANCYIALADRVKLVAIADTVPEKAEKFVKATGAKVYTSGEELLKNEKPDIIDVCVPTYLHTKFAVEAMEMGCHVFCEKPICLNEEEAKLLLETEKKTGMKFQVGQVLRFIKEYKWTKEMVEKGTYGRVLAGHFARLSSNPFWGWENWFMDPSRSGGCITDLHIHDIDVIRYLFGEPDAVSSRTTSSVSLHDTVHTSLFYGSFPVTAVGDWSQLGVSFEAKCSVSLEAATAVFDGKSLLIYPKDGTESYVAASESVSGYQAEIDYFCDVITGKIKNTKNTARSAAETVRLIEHLHKSAECGGKIIEFRAN